mmetsp:Transcript_20502/g.59409  ORF Transcript_20502/g.59409 Transcript_20502/m.59409 type:complete len:234 (+) Transcript_20502:38-739(+)
MKSSMFLFAFFLNGMATAFQSVQYGKMPGSTRVMPSSSRLNAVSYDNCLDIGYSTVVPKPMGIIFGENPDPYYGLVVDDVAEGQNGGRAGLRVGDQLMAVGNDVVVGMDFDSVMSKLQAAQGNVELVMYRGTVANLYTILGNQMDEGDFIRDDDDGEEEVIMDENYESPVKIEVKEKKPLSPGDFFKAAGKVGKMLFDDDKPKQSKEEKKKQGFFGIGGETIQLDGNDADTLK